MDASDTRAIQAAVREYVAGAEDKLAAIEAIREVLFDLSPQKAQPVDFVRWIPLEKVEPNDYNPNSVARIEMGLLLKSIQHDGYTQPCVVIYDEKRDKYVLVDGFHRYSVMRSNEALRDLCGGHLPCVVLHKSISERMASTIRHNRARGKHSVAGLSNLVFKMLDSGMSDADICNELGMEPEEVLRLKHITGFSKLFADVEYNKAWVSRAQIRIQQQAKKAAEQGQSAETD